MCALEGHVSKGVRQSKEGGRLNQKITTTSKPQNAATTGRPRTTPRRQPAADSASARRLSDSLLLQYEREGFLVTPQLLAADAVLDVRHAVQQHVKDNKLAALKQRVRVLCPGVDPSPLSSEAHALKALARHSTQELGFLQFFHLRHSCPTVHDLVTGPQLAATAAQLLGVKRVRLYQDCVFLKEPGYVETNWHSDLRMAPFDTNHFITAWIPLRPIRSSETDSGLLFAAGSHRDFALPFWHDLEGRALDDRGYQLKDTGVMGVGDVSWHHGWTLHCAGVQPQGSKARLALTASFFADGARVLARRGDPSVRGELLHDEDAESYQGWLKDVKDGAVARHELLPLVHS